MQIKTTMSYHYTYTTTVKIKPLTAPRVGGDAEQLELLYTAGSANYLICFDTL